MEKQWTSNVKYHQIMHDQCNEDQPVGPEKVLDLVQSRRWSAGGLWCLAATLRQVLSPGMRRLVSMGYIYTLSGQLGAETGSTQNSKYQYRDHLVGQLTNQHQPLDLFHHLQYTDWEHIDDGYLNQKMIGDVVGDFFFVCPCNYFAQQVSLIILDFLSNKVGTSK